MTKLKVKNKMTLVSLAAVAGIAVAIVSGISNVAGLKLGRKMHGHSEPTTSADEAAQLAEAIRLSQSFEGAENVAAFEAQSPEYMKAQTEALAAIEAAHVEERRAVEEEAARQVEAERLRHAEELKRKNWEKLQRDAEKLFTTDEAQLRKAQEVSLKEAELLEKKQRSQLSRLNQEKERLARQAEKERVAKEQRQRETKERELELEEKHRVAKEKMKAAADKKSALRGGSIDDSSLLKDARASLAKSFAPAFNPLIDGARAIAAKTPSDEEARRELRLRAIEARHAKLANQSRQTKAKSEPVRARGDDDIKRQKPKVDTGFADDVALMRARLSATKAMDKAEAAAAASKMSAKPLAAKPAASPSPKPVAKKEDRVSEKQAEARALPAAGRMRPVPGDGHCGYHSINTGLGFIFGNKRFSTHELAGLAGDWCLAAAFNEFDIPYTRENVQIALDDMATLSPGAMRNGRLVQEFEDNYMCKDVMDVDKLRRQGFNVRFADTRWRNNWATGGALKGVAEALNIRIVVKNPLSAVPEVFTPNLRDGEPNGTVFVRFNGVNHYDGLSYEGENRQQLRDYVAQPAPQLLDGDVDASEVISTDDDFLRVCAANFPEIAADLRACKNRCSNAYTAAEMQAILMSLAPGEGDADHSDVFSVKPEPEAPVVSASGDEQFSFPSYIIEEHCGKKVLLDILKIEKPYCKYVLKNVHTEEQWRATVQEVTDAVKASNKSEKDIMAILNNPFMAKYVTVA